MSRIYLSENENSAIQAVDVQNLERLIDEALSNENAAGLYKLHLTACGPLVAGCLRRFERDLVEYAKSR